MDGIPALDLWDLLVEVFQSSLNQSEKSTPSNRRTRNQTKVPIHHDNLELSDVDFVLSSAKSSQSIAMLYVFEDNEAVALDLLFDWIDLDPKIQIRYIDTKHQLADILTKGNFTRDEWNNLLYLFDITHCSSLCSAKNFS